MDDAALLRYSRQIMLPEIDVAGQERLLASRVLVLGMGGLGCPAALYLAAAGVGELVLADGDQVETSNLQRQILHDSASIGRDKVDSAAERLRALNPGVRLQLLNRRLDAAQLREQVRRVDLVLDGTDNLATRYALNQACLQQGVPWIAAAAIRFEAQLTAFDPRQPDSPCYRCLWPDAEEVAMNCAENGVIAPLVGTIGSLQALEAIKLLSGMGSSLVGRVLVLDAIRLQWQQFRLQRHPHCQDCHDSVGRPGD